MAIRSSRVCQNTTARGQGYTRHRAAKEETEMTISISATGIPDFLVYLLFGLLVVWAVTASVDIALRIVLRWKERHAKR